MKIEKSRSQYVFSMNRKIKKMTRQLMIAMMKEKDAEKAKCYCDLIKKLADIQVLLDDFYRDLKKIKD